MIPLKLSIHLFKFYVFRRYSKNNIPTPFGKFRTFQKVFTKKRVSYFLNNALIIVHANIGCSPKGNNYFIVFFQK